MRKDKTITVCGYGFENKVHGMKPKAVIRLLLCLVVMLATACNDADTGLPKSAGRPSEVLLVGDVDSIVAKALTADIVALPQPEPMFDIKTNGKANIKKNGKTNGKTNGKGSNGSDAQDALNAVSRLERNIVVVNIDPTLFTRTAVRYERNVFAAPQIIVYVNTPSAQALKSDIGRCHIDRLLLQNELTAHAERLKRHHEKGVEDDIKRMFGCSMTIPKGMRVNVRGQQFVWISDNNPTKMSNICLYTSENRDSVMRINLKGETDSMFMTTVGGSVVTTTGTSRDNMSTTLRRGLWQMQGDAMGGPFMSRTIHMPHGKTIVAEAFVFAPGEQKRDIMRRLEASVQTLRPLPKTTKQK